MDDGRDSRDYRSKLLSPQDVTAVIDIIRPAARTTCMASAYADFSIPTPAKS